MRGPPPNAAHVEPVPAAQRHTEQHGGRFALKNDLPKLQMSNDASNDEPLCGVRGAATANGRGTHMTTE